MTSLFVHNDAAELALAVCERLAVAHVDALHRADEYRVIAFDVLADRAAVHGCDAAVDESRAAFGEGELRVGVCAARLGGAGVVAGNRLLFAG